ncbi:hypothetical protein [Rhodococcus tibetensis]|uniref:DUF8176 domain-containing protein n=1 Tax=Rhodococcus tibetensis TaxID=2965064 RepID=A0ABT1QB34_9NOCA|nr:hypothetical protein [Rhodococcus sp. FXJ9.536]MCQ4119486.1 hypothetical protein [Rhodococcus sp. FXJ9.536]
MTEPPRRNDDSAPLDRFAHWFPPFAPAAATTASASAAEPTEVVADSQPELAPPPAPTWLAPSDDRDTTPVVREGRVKQKLAFAGAASALGAVLVGVVAVLTSETSNETGTPVAAADPGWCTESRNGGTVTGNGPGGTSDGTETILAFDHAYYVERSGAKAREVVTADAPMGSAEAIQRGIDSLPEGTEHCLAITSTEPGRYAVTLTEQRPDGSTHQYQQVVTTTDHDGRTYITSIGDAQ